MAKPTAQNLRLYVEQHSPVTPPQVEMLGSLPEVLRAFQTATGWPLRYVAGSQPSRPNDLSWSAPVNPGVGAALGHLRLDSVAPQPNTDASLIELESARELASAIAGTLGELIETRHALWQREAELAAGVPLVPHSDEQQHLAARLQAVLEGGAKAVDCQAAALYLLDDATTELKLRSSWGLPFDRLTASARQLRGAVADLEALLGHAVVLEDTQLTQNWKVPEAFPAAVCVPVSTPTTLLGTLWVYADEKRSFSDRQTNILEVVAGRLAADLEREMLMREGIDGAELKRQVAAVERLQRNQLPSISPLLEGWELAGWTAHAEAVGGGFYDWFCLPDGLLAASVGDAAGRGLQAAMSSTALKAALRAHGQYHQEAQQTLKQLNLTLWTGSAGDQYATLFYGLVETATGRVRYASAGQPGLVLLGSDNWESISQTSAPLGEGPESDYREFECYLKPGEALVVFTKGLRDAVDGEGRPLGEVGVVKQLVGRTDLTADQLATLAHSQLSAHTMNIDREDCTILVIKRTKP